ncbi:MAG: tetratricopeptide repeat protein [Candidatus Edwardsbacteria bacterium]|nr:tetratricopeptide repeat protein [Candidatus Edwardsbacteria bacterium]
MAGCVSGTPEEHLKTGALAFQKGDTTAAIEEFKKSIRLNKDFAPAHYNLGICYSTPKTRDKAIEQFGKAIVHDPQYVEAYIALGQAYMRKDSLAGAVDVLQRGLALGIAPEKFYGNLGYCYLMKAVKDSAIHYYQRAIGRDSSNAEYYFNIAYLLNGPQRIDQSIAYLRMAKQRAADPLQVSYLLGCRLLDKPNRTRKETEEGIALLEDYLARGGGEMMKTAKAREKLSQARLKK